VELSYLGSHSYVGKKFSDIYPALLGHCDKILQEDTLVAACSQSDVVFLALPAGIASNLVTRALLSDTVIIDLGADFRLKDKELYKQWYSLTHGNEELLHEAVYGLCELHRDEIKKANLIANPGCYTTCSILSLVPALPFIEKNSLIIDACSGVSGAGRGEKVSSLYCECNESMKAYGIANHRHTPEIEQELSLQAGGRVMVQFTPHLVPMSRGIFITCTANLNENVTKEMITLSYHKKYEGQECIRLYDDASKVETRFVEHTNTVAIGWSVDDRTRRLVICGALDNLYKGAAGQAVQNMNIRFGFAETEGLETYTL
jgi:N-acetyl-gamma-glutamyl-phosphate reductase